ncbi:ankyrin repeat-containing domain protein [Diplogelasinospora grovesii]|uniref:Ankyrin repeat-containing domain protein n=1 Tax=Diplogelasinospora grovesii TaxID=303347 RepID=A0AAN6RZ94_9PEZI|nr:ankyrin repeat-containing domain protein [Diplogelasinospora grovesii]
MCRFSLYHLLRDWWDREDLDLSQTNDNHQTLLELAAHSGSREICEVLLRRGMQVDILSSSSYGSPLAAAASRGHEEIVKLLIDNGADPNLLSPYK